MGSGGDPQPNREQRRDCGSAGTGTGTGTTRTEPPIHPPPPQSRGSERPAALPVPPGAPDRPRGSALKGIPAALPYRRRSRGIPARCRRSPPIPPSPPIPIPPPPPPPFLTLMRTSASMMEVKVCRSSPSAMAPLPVPAAPPAAVGALRCTERRNRGGRGGGGEDGGRRRRRACSEGAAPLLSAGGGRGAAGPGRYRAVPPLHRGGSRRVRAGRSAERSGADGAPCPGAALLPAARGRSKRRGGLFLEAPPGGARVRRER